jgi:hypothetical protein
MKCTSSRGGDINGTARRSVCDEGNCKRLVEASGIMGTEERSGSIFNQVTVTVSEAWRLEHKNGRLALLFGERPSKWCSRVQS